MNKSWSRLLPGLCLVSSVCVPMGADDKDITFIEADKAGVDYTVQGEYAGKDSSGAKLGVQVIALGDGMFHFCIEPGGLPGDGSDGKTNKIEFNGATDDGVVSAGGHGYKVTIKAGKFTGTDDKGKPFTCTHLVRHSPTEGLKPPANAQVLFDGTNADHWEHGSMDERKWLKWDTFSKELFTNFTMHLEFFLPFKPYARGQERGNSGVYLQYRYEIQVLDTFGLKGEKNECGAIYNLSPPLVNMCYPPLTWQTYDVEFVAGKWADGKRLKGAIATVKHNGVLVQDHTEIPDATPVAGLKDGPEPGPIYLQQHDNPVFYQNIWVVENK